MRRVTTSRRCCKKAFKINFSGKKSLFNSNYELFWALKDINLNVKKGEFIGIIGDNGAGKTTLLKVISKILSPTEGVVNINGRITPLLELGLGVHPELTAKENIYIYGSILGLNKNELNNKCNKIIEFAGLERFANAKLKSF